MGLSGCFGGASQANNTPLPTAGGAAGTEYAFTAAPKTGALALSELKNGSEGWAEIVNPSDGPCEASNWFLTDDADEPMKYRLPAVALGAGEYLVIELNELEDGYPYHAGFKLSRAENALYLYYADGSLEDSMVFDQALPGPVSVVNTPEGPAYTAHITKGSANSESTFPELTWTADEGQMPVIINEVLPDNKYGITDAEGDRSDWAELYNRSSEPVSLGGLFLSDRKDDPEKWALPDEILGPDEYLLVFLSGKDCREGELHASFSLSEKDDGIFLFDYDGMRFSGFEIPEGLNPNISIGRMEGGFVGYFGAPTPGEANTTYGFGEYFGVGGFSPTGVYISEVSGVSAPRSGGSDWVELYNASGEDMDITGWRLTDDPVYCYAEPCRPEAEANGSLHFGEMGPVVPFGSVLRAGQYLVSPVTFGVSQSGDTLYLFDAEGAVRDVFKTGVTAVGVTSGRENGSVTGERVFFTEPTMGYANAEPHSGYAAEPRFGSDGLYCTGTVRLELACATPGAEIRYTLDGSLPGKSSRLYTGPFDISSNTVVRARAYAEGLVPSAAVTHTYVFDEQSSLPVVCVSLSQSDYERMYVASQRPSGAVDKGDEVPCSVEYYIEGREAFSSGAGVRVSGASTALYAQKSLGLYFRAGYGRSSLDYPLFEGCDVTSFDSLVLRNGGQDAYYARLRDSYMSSICQGLDIDVAYFRPVIVYVNGNYRGIYDLKENLNEDYVASHYNVDSGGVDIIKRNTVLLAGSKTDWNSLREFCQTADFSQQSNYEALAERVDADSVIDYVIARTYFFDGDMFNQKYWRSEGVLKWRAVFFDSDYAMMGNYAGTNILPNYFNKNGVTSFHGSKTNMDIYCALVQNAGWRDAFILRYFYLTKYVFCPENALPAFDALVEVYRPEMQRHCERWRFNTYSQWERETAAMRRCIEARPQYALYAVKNLFGLSDAQFNEYEARAEAVHSGMPDPGASVLPAPPPGPAPTAVPTPGPTATPAPGETAEPTAAPGETPGPTAAPGETPGPTATPAPEP